MGIELYIYTIMTKDESMNAVKVNNTTPLNTEQRNSVNVQKALSAIHFSLFVGNLNKISKTKPFPYLKKSIFLGYLRVSTEIFLKRNTSFIFSYLRHFLSFVD